MTTRLVTGPPGAGKTTFVEKNKKDGDTVIDLDVLRAQYGDAAKDVRKTLEASVQTLPGDVWVIRTLADAQARTEAAERLEAAEVHVLTTPAEVCKQRIAARDISDDQKQELSSAVDNWFEHYGVVESHLIVEPDTGPPSDKETKKMGDLNNEDLGFPKDTPLAEMTTEQQVAYWKHQSRKHESESKRLKAERDPKPADRKDDGNGEQGKPQFDAAAFKEELKKELRLEQAPGLVRDRFSSLIGNRLPAAAKEALLEDLNLNRFVNDDGSLKHDLIKERVEVLAPSSPAGNHQGHRGGNQTSTSSVQKGRDLFNETHSK